MSAIGPKQTWARALHMSAFGGKADMTFCGSPLSRSLLGVKQTSLFATHMSAFDLQRTSSAKVFLRCTAQGFDEASVTALALDRGWRRSRVVCPRWQ